MHRRRYLETLVAVATLAGCSQSDSQEATNTDNSPTETQTPTETATVSPTATDTPEPDLSVTYPLCNTVRINAPEYSAVFIFQTDGDVARREEGYSGTVEFSVGETITEVTVYASEGVKTVQNPQLKRCRGGGNEETTTDQETETERRGPPRATEDLDQATALLEEALTAYKEPSAAINLNDVELKYDIDTQKVRGTLPDARESFYDAETFDLSPSQQARLSNLRGIQWFLWWLPTVHKTAQKARKVTDNAWTLDALDTGNTRSAISDFDTELSKLTSDSKPEDMQSFDPVSVNDYKAHVGYYQSIRGGLGDLRSNLEDYTSARSTFDSAMRSHEEGDYETAQERFGNAKDAFIDVSDSLEKLSIDVPGENILNRAICLADGMARRSEDYAHAAAAGVEGKQTRRIVREEEAQKPINC